MVARVLILAGGTGGHIFPALAVAEVLRGRGCEIRWMGTRTGMEARLVPPEGIEMEWLAIAGVRGKGWLSLLQAPFKIVNACWQAARILRRYRPDVVVGFGGFVAGPGGIMASLLGIPLVIHEQNRIPGTTNRLLVKWSSTVLEAFPNSFKPKVQATCVGNPLRRTLVESMAAGKPDKGAATRVLVLGGSLGAKALNETVPHALAKAGAQLEIRHQTGQAMCELTRQTYADAVLAADVVAFIQDMAEAYRWADLAICRAGAVTVSELALMGLPALLIPFPHAIDDHQTANARYLSESGAAVLIPQTQLTAEFLAAQLKALIDNPQRLADMSQRAKTLAKPDAAEQVAECCLSEAKR